MPLLNRLGDNMFTEIDQVVLKALHEDVSIENVNSHGGLKQLDVLRHADRAE